jgi:hypothetical protein
LGDIPKKQDWALVDGLWGGGVAFGGGIDFCGRVAFDPGAGLAGRSRMFGTSCAGKGSVRNADCDETFIWIWRTERVPAVFEGLIFATGKIVEER